MSEYRIQYLPRLCAQNRRLFTSPYVWQFQPEELPLNPRGRFSENSKTCLEIGFGHGEVLEELAQRHPNVIYVGIERRPSRVNRCIKRLTRIQTQNVLLLRVNLELIETSLFAPASFDLVLINHPDPWPKHRHAGHRLFQPTLLDELARLLAPSGRVEVASDHREYFSTILRLFMADRRFESLLPAPFYTTEPLQERAMSRFEKMKRAAGETVGILRFCKK